VSVLNNVCMYCSLVSSVYAAETWSLPVASVRSLEAAH